MPVFSFNIKTVGGQEYAISQSDALLFMTKLCLCYAAAQSRVVYHFFIYKRGVKKDPHSKKQKKSKKGQLCRIYAAALWKYSFRMKIINVDCGLDFFQHAHCLEVIRPSE